MLVINLSNDSIAFEPARCPTWREGNVLSFREGEASERAGPSTAIEYTMSLAREAEPVLSLSFSDSPRRLTETVGRLSDP